MTNFRIAPGTAPFLRGRQSLSQQRLAGAVVRIWQQNHDMLHNAGSLFGTTIVTSALGFVFWALAARLFNPHAVGFGSAAISAITVLGTIGMFGLNTLLIGELPHRESKAALVSAAL